MLLKPEDVEDYRGYVRDSKFLAKAHKIDRIYQEEWKRQGSPRVKWKIDAYPKKNREINVLSLFDGIATGRFILEHIVGYKIKNYYSSEIENDSIAIARHHYPQNIFLGDVNNWKDWNIDWKSIDILIGGSPCQSISCAGSQTGLIDKTKSGLFYVYMDILAFLKKNNPNIKFFLENVIPAKKEFELEMTQHINKVMGFWINPIKLNASDFSAQQRWRNYWFNWDYKLISLLKILEK